jgi:acetyl esterase
MSSDRPYRPAPELQRVLDEIERIGNPLDTLTDANVADLWLLREIFAARTLGPVPGCTVRDLCVPVRNRQIPVRVYTPTDPGPGGDGRPPVVVFYHGGGWALGSVATYDSLCRALSRGLAALVVSVDYRLAPEHPFPAAVADAHLAFEWAARNADDLGGDPRRLVLAGDSAGGTLATVIARRARQEGLPVVLQVLLYPAADLTGMDYPSLRQYGEGYWLTARGIETFRNIYLPDPRDWSHPDASPTRAADAELRRLPPAFIMTAGCDPLRDDGQAYADRLRALGVSVTYRVEPDMTHAWLNLFNNALFPEASRFVEPRLEALIQAIRATLTSVIDSRPSAR